MAIACGVQPKKSPPLYRDKDNALSFHFIANNKPGNHPDTLSACKLQITNSLTPFNKFESPIFAAETENKNVQI